MSRENDIKALKELKNNMVEADAFAELANEEWEKARQIKAELENTKFVFKPLPTNNYETTKAGYKKAWKEFFSNTRKFRVVFLTIYSLAMFILAVLLFIAAFNNNGFIFSDSHKYTDTAGKILTALIAAAFPIVIGGCSWISITPFDEIINHIKSVLISLGVSGVLFAVVCDWTNSMHLLVIILATLPVAMLVTLVIHLFFLVVSKIHILTPKKRANLVVQRQNDMQNANINETNEPKEKAEWEKWWEGYKPELRERGLHHISLGDTAMEKAKAHLEAAEESTVLGENEKSPEVIDLLINFIESRRADSIKEALHEYDKMEQNKKLLEIEAIKANLEIEKAKKENADRQHEMEMNRRHQIEMEAQARRNADMQSQIAANTAAAAASAERMRKDAASAAADAAATQARVASDVSAIYRNEYYNS